MNLRNCSRCGKMFNYIAGPIMCENCKKELEEDFQKVKKYITDNPTASLKQITDDNNVKTSQIREWIREERLMFAKESPIQLTCENCGAPIQTGRYCAKCKGTMANGLNNAFAKPKPELKKTLPKDEKGGMRFLDK
mgnify:FL=1